MQLPARYMPFGTAMDGGMSSVLPYKDQYLDRKVALKLIAPGPNARRIQDELEALFKLRSKHVVQVYDVVRDATSIGIVQEFIEGDDLFSEKHTPKDSITYLKMIWQVASGISEIHDAGVIHRDIKPNNMKVDHEGILKIFDFGLAREEGANAATVGFVGTHGFAAPELYASRVRFTPAVDVFAFGATALYLGLRDLPAELKSPPPTAVLHNPFKQLPFAVPDEVAEVLFLCLETDASLRPSMSVVRSTIERHLLYDRHRALVVNGAEASYLDCSNRSVGLKYGNYGSIRIEYDGFDFIVTAAAGSVFLNNIPAKIGDRLPGACVLTLGGPELRANRAYVTFDLSNPGIVL